MSTLAIPTQVSTMQAALFYQPGDVRIETVSIPQPAVGELVITVGAALTCGTDLKAYRRGHPVLLKNFPAPFGHECAGTVAAIGASVTGFKIGDRVVVANSAPCKTCYFCQKQAFNLCENLGLINGAYAQYLKVPSQIVLQNTLKIPNSLPFEKAAFTEPLAVSLRGFEACHVNPGDSVAVIGLGAVGQFLVKLAKLQGAHVTALGRNPLKRSLATTFGEADEVLDIRDYTEAQPIKAQFSPQGHGFDVVIEAVGQPETWQLAVDLVRRGGLVNWFGGCASGTTVTLDTRRVHYDELTLISLFHHTPAYFRKALALIATNQIDPSPLITDVMALSQVVQALERVESGAALKIAFFPNKSE